MSFLDLKWLNFSFSNQLNQKNSIGSLLGIFSKLQWTWSCLIKPIQKELFLLFLSFFLNTKNQHVPLITYIDKRDKRILQCDGLRFIQKNKEHLKHTTNCFKGPHLSFQVILDTNKPTIQSKNSLKDIVNIPSYAHPK